MSIDTARGCRDWLARRCSYPLTKSSSFGIHGDNSRIQPAVHRSSLMPPFVNSGPVSHMKSLPIGPSTAVQTVIGPIYTSCSTRLSPFRCCCQPGSLSLARTSCNEADLLLDQMHPLCATILCDCHCHLHRRTTTAAADRPLTPEDTPHQQAVVQQLFVDLSHNVCPYIEVFQSLLAACLFPALNPSLAQTVSR